MHPAALLVALLALGGAAHAFSTASVRFHGTGGNTAVDRIKVGIDPAVAADVGAADFTVELWLRGTRQDNDAPTDGYRQEGQEERANVDWIFGNIFIDRDIFGPGPDWGMSIHRDGDAGSPAVLRFGTQGASDDSQHTLQGHTGVLDGAWHHVAFVRERASGTKRIFVDGALDVVSSQGVSNGDLSYPDGRASQFPNSDPFLVFGAEKHGFLFTQQDPFPSFNGFMDEIRLWTIARTGDELRASMVQTLAPDTPGLALYLRLEEGSGQTLTDTAGGGPATLFAGVPGNGEWSPVTPPPVSTSSTTTTTVLGATTSSTLPQACAADSQCDDGDPCTDDRCDAGVCAATPTPGVAGIACRIDGLASGALCSGAEGDADLEAVVDGRLVRARRLLLRSTTATAARARRLQKRAAGELAKIRRRTAKALRRERITPACAAAIDTGAGGLLNAILALPAPSP